jgi:hypothetical protein
MASVWCAIYSSSVGLRIASAPGKFSESLLGAYQKNSNGPHCDNHNRSAPLLRRSNVA